MRLVLIFFSIGLLLSSCDRQEAEKAEEIPLTGQLVFETGEIIFSDQTLKEVCFSETGEELAAMVTLTTKGAADLLKFTTENVNKSMTLTFQGNEYFSATIREPISGQIPVALILLSPSEETKNEMKGLFGVSEIEFCKD